MSRRFPTGWRDPTPQPVGGALLQPGLQGWARFDSVTGNRDDGCQQIEQIDLATLMVQGFAADGVRFQHGVSAVLEKLNCEATERSRVDDENGLHGNYPVQR